MIPPRPSSVLQQDMDARQHADITGTSSGVIAMDTPAWPHFLAGQPGQPVRVLLVDDLADSGHTLHAVINMLKTNYAPITELRSAVIWTKGLSTFSPDYSVEFLPSNPWIHQPFEGYDSLSPEKLLEKWRV